MSFFPTEHLGAATSERGYNQKMNKQRNVDITRICFASITFGVNAALHKERIERKFFFNLFQPL